MYNLSIARPSHTGINVVRPTLFLALVLGLVLGLSACGGGGDVAPTPDVPASVQAGIAEALATPTPDISATVEAGVEATIQAITSPTISPDAVANFDKGVEYYDQGLIALAIAEFTKAIDLDPTYADAYYNRGITYERLGDSYEANQDFAKACEMDSSLC